MTFGEYLRSLREQVPLTQPQVARLTGLSVNGIGRIERRAKKPEHVFGSTLTLMARAYLGANANGKDLLERYLKARMPKAPARGSSRGKPTSSGGAEESTQGKGIPVVGHASASGPTEWFDARHGGEADEYLPAPSIYSPDAFALKISGDSMEDSYRDGDYIICEPIACENLRPGDDVVIQIGDDRATFKRLYESVRGRGYLMLLPLNRSHKPIEVSCDDVTRVGIVRAIHRPVRRNDAGAGEYHNSPPKLTRKGAMMGAMASAIAAPILALGGTLIGTLVNSDLLGA